MGGSLAVVGGLLPVAKTLAWLLHLFPLIIGAI